MKNERKDQSQTPLNQSTVSGDTTDTPLTLQQIQRYAEEKNLPVKEFMKRYYLSEERPPNPQKIIISSSS
jgi:hypothetical protein